MATAPIDTVIRHLRRAALRQDRTARTDGQLLASFLDQKDEAAFAALVQRHGPMVWGVCRRVVDNHHDAEDAFQATFLVLARKAASVRPRERVANWLHGVAFRTALKARATAGKRRARERQVTEMPEPEAVQQDHWSDLQPLLDQELNGLPENYRLPILLCDLEGKTIREAAQQLGWPQGTLAGRLARGRKLLARRLASRGVVLSAGVLAAVLSQNAASAGVPASLMSSTVKAATMLAAGQATAAGVIPVRVAALTEGVMKGMMLTKLGKAVPGLVVLGVVVFGSGLLAHRPATGQPTKREQGGDQPAVGQSVPPRRDAGTVAEAGARPAPARTDLDRLQGVWSAVTIEQWGGKPARLDRAVFFMVDGKRACWQASDWEMQGGLYLDLTSKPRSYDLATSTRTIEGIYALDGDTLRLCYDMAAEPRRPGRFITEKGSQQVLVVLKRLHGPEVFPFRLADGTRAFPRILEKASTPPPQEAPVPENSGPRYDNGFAAPGSDEPPAPGNRQPDFPVKASEGKRVPAEPEELKQLQGTWRRVGGFHGKEPDVPGVAPGDVLKSTDLLIEGNEWVGWTRDGKRQKVAFRVDASTILDIKDEGFAAGLAACGLSPDAVKAPKRLDVQEVGGAYVHGIYGLSGDDLVIRLLPGGKQGRPTRFAMTIEDGVLLFYKRSASGGRRPPVGNGGPGDKALAR